MPKKIWCLFSIYNEYNQPDNNLEAWWSTKPDFHDIRKIINNDPDAGKLSRGEEVRYGRTDYRIQEITEGVKV